MTFVRIGNVTVNTDQITHVQWDWRKQDGMLRKATIHFSAGHLPTSFHTLENQEEVIQLWQVLHPQESLPQEHL